MAKLPLGKQKLMFGCYYSLEPKGTSVVITSDIRWYGLPVLIWKVVNREYQIKWYNYPRLMWRIAKYTVKWVRGKQ